MRHYRDQTSEYLCMKRESTRYVSANTNRLVRYNNLVQLRAVVHAATTPLSLCYTALYVRYRCISVLCSLRKRHKETTCPTGNTSFAGPVKRVKALKQEQGSGSVYESSIIINRFKPCPAMCFYDRFHKSFIFDLIIHD